MSDNQNRISKFWLELKRRKVVRIVTVYAASTFVILELVDIIAEPFGLPVWTLKLVFVLLVVGLVVSVVLSWIYDIAPSGGIVKTGKDPATEPQPKKDSNGWKIATYVSFGVIIALIIINILPRHGNAGDVPVLETSIGVLPFRNMSGEQEYEYFCEGMTDAMISRLSKINGIGKIPSRTSMMRYRNSEMTIPEIALELQVTHILEAGFQKSGDVIKINLSLLDGKSDKAFWSEEYTGNYQDIFRIQAEVAEMVAAKLDVDVTALELADIRQTMTENVEAYNLYIKGNYEFNAYTAEGNNRAIEYMKKAVDLDSTFALAYAGLAYCYLGLASVHSSELGALEAMALARPYLDKALSLGPDLPEAHLWNGYYYLYNDWDFTGAEQEYKEGIADENPVGMIIYADLLNFTGRYEEAFAIAEQVIRKDPLFPNGRLSMCFYYLGEYETALEYAESRIILFNNYYSLAAYGFVLLNTGNYKKAIQILNKTIETNGARIPRLLGWMGAAYARLGNNEEALGLMEELIRLSEQGTAGSPAFYAALIHAALGDRTKALEWLQDAVDRHEMEIPWLKTEPQLYDLHDEPAFRELLEKVGFP